MKSFLYLAAFGGAIAVLGGLGGACGGSSSATSLSTSATTTSATTTGASSGAGGKASSSTSTGTGGMGGASATSTTTGSTSATTGGSGGACASGLGDACSDCTAAKCASTYCPCYNDPSCGALVMCLDKCAAGDTACQNACFSDSPNSVAEAVLLGNCAASNCDADCPGVMATTACGVCTAEKCTAQFNTCFANSACAQIVECVEAGGGALTCFGKYPTGQAAAEALETCATSMSCGCT